MKILVIDNNCDIHDNLIDFLQLNGHEVKCALDGLSGLHLAATNSFDAIILDILLPDIDGTSICHSLRQHLRPDVTIMVLSARSTLEDRLMGFSAREPLKNTSRFGKMPDRHRRAA